MMQVPDAAVAAVRALERAIGRKAGGSTGTGLWSALKIVAEMVAEGRQGSVVTLLCDPGDRYLDKYYSDAWLAGQGLDIAPYSGRSKSLASPAGCRRPCATGRGRSPRMAWSTRPPWTRTSRDPSGSRRWAAGCQSVWAIVRTLHSQAASASPSVTARRNLGSGPQPARIRAAQADLLRSLPGVHLSDLDELRARGVLGTHPATTPAPRRTLGVGGRAEEEQPQTA